MIENVPAATVNWEFDGLLMCFEQVLWAPYLRKMPMDLRDLDQLPDWPFSGTRIEVYGSKQMMFFERHGGGYQVFDSEGKPYLTQHGNFTTSEHDHVENFVNCIRSRELPNSDIEQLHISTCLSHYGNIAYRTRQWLEIDPKTEGFVNNDAANALVKRTYREPYVVPEVV